MTGEPPGSRRPFTRYRRRSAGPPQRDYERIEDLFCRLSRVGTLLFHEVPDRAPTGPRTRCRPSGATVLKTLDAKLVLAGGTLGMKGAAAKSEGIAAWGPARDALLRQFKNPPFRPEIHFRTTGPEIRYRRQSGLVKSGVGMGGTITGVSLCIKGTHGKSTVSVAVEPETSPLITRTRAGLPLKPGPHEIQGIGASSPTRSTGSRSPGAWRAKRAFWPASRAEPRRQWRSAWHGSRNSRVS